MMRGDMKVTERKRIQFFVEKEDYERLEEYAKRKGLTIDNLCRMTAFQWLERYPLKRGKKE